MTDEERIAKLTELARKVWPDQHDLLIDDDREWSSASVRDDVDGEALLMIEDQPRALDALEAALLVLAGEAPPQPHWVDELWGRWTAWAMQHESMQARCDPETESLHEGAVLAYRRCAAELRERVKEGT